MDNKTYTLARALGNVVKNEIWVNEGYSDVTPTVDTGNYEGYSGNSMLPARLLVAALLPLFASCHNSQQSAPLVVHVWRDRSATFADGLRRADLQFGSTKPHVKSGTGVVVGTTESGFQTLLDRMIRDGVDKYGPEILILESETDVPATIKQQLGKPKFVCGLHPAFIPTPVSGDLREASEMYLNFVVAHC